MPLEERCAIIKELACVDEVIGFNDSDDTAINAIGQVLATPKAVVGVLCLPMAAIDL